MQFGNPKKTSISSFKRRPALSILLPVYNEAETIADVIKTYHREVCEKISAELVVAEDGSTDGTKEILASLQNEFPIKLLSNPNRKGYAKAVGDALKSCRGDWTFFSDSDGQYSPSDFWKLWKQRNDFDMIIGWREHRRDKAHRIVLAEAFHKMLNSLFGLAFNDGDSGFRLIREEVVHSVIGTVRFLDYSFWSEFTIRACFAGFRVCEVPISHSQRNHGDTHIYKSSETGMIVLKQLKGLAGFKKDLRRKLRVK